MSEFDRRIESLVPLIEKGYQLGNKPNWASIQFRLSWKAYPSYFETCEALKIADVPDEFKSKWGV